MKKDGMGTVIKDFYKSDAPQFKGKSKKKRREMAIAAKLTAERGPQSEGFKTDILTDRKYGKRMADKEREHKERDARMKYGKSYKKFTSDAKSAKDRLRPGEVRKFNKETGKWESNKD